jgi:hypothetical protein
MYEPFLLEECVQSTFVSIVLVLVVCGCVYHHWRIHTIARTPCHCHATRCKEHKATLARTSCYVRMCLCFVFVCVVFVVFFGDNPLARAGFGSNGVGHLLFNLRRRRLPENMKEYKVLEDTWSFEEWVCLLLCTSTQAESLAAFRTVNRCTPVCLEGLTRGIFEDTSLSD